MTLLVCQHVPRGALRASHLGALLLALSGCPERDGGRGGAEPQPSEADAPDRDVQKGADPATPAPTWYACSSGLIPFAQVCDGTLDCERAEDEVGCQDSFVCALENGRPGLFPRSAWCDGKLDCTQYGQDEEDCPDRQQFVCLFRPLTLVTAEQFCDGVVDCNHSDTVFDESDCADVVVCGERLLDGRAVVDAIPRSQICDGRWDCRTDEYDCPGGEHFTCGDGKTIPRASQCDGEEQCWDRSDEGASACPDQVRCQPVTLPGRYISLAQICDGRADCPGGWEEQGCGNFFACGGGLFVRSEKRCDGSSDCPGGEDELSCAP
jgi:hypothetical protein